MWTGKEMRSVLGPVYHTVSLPKCPALEEAHSLRVQEGTFLPNHDNWILPALCRLAQ